MLDQIVNEYFLPYFKEAEKPPAQWKIGLEQEVMGFDKHRHQRIGYVDHLRPILQGFADRFDWEPYYEGENLVGLTQQGSSITIEPGGQLELSLAPLATLGEVERQLKAYRSQLAILSTDRDIYWVSMGYDPLSKPDEIPLVPKKRYEIMANYLPPLGSGAAHMMRLTCTAQANLDYASERDMVDKMRIAVAFSSIASILFSSSPLRRGGIAGFKSLRNWSWRALDPARSGFLEFVFQPDFGYRRYIEYALSVPMMVLERPQQTVDASGFDFREFLSRGLRQERFTPRDWAVQLGSLFPVARLRNAIETRTCDAGPMPMLIAQAAFWKGLLYHPASREQGLRIIEAEGLPVFLKLHEKAYLEGFDCLKKYPKRIALVGQVLDLARIGLEALGEAHYLEPLYRVFLQREAISDRLIQAFLSAEDKGVYGLLQEQDLIFA